MSDYLGPEQRERYARHLVLPGVGHEGQEKLLKSSVLVVGAGGLGSPALMYLAAAGIGRIGIIDNDKVSSSNLQRQIIHNVSWVGKSKVESASNWIKGLNSDIDVIGIDDRLTQGNSLEILADYDVIIDGTDNFQSRYLIGDSCEVLDKSWIFGSIHRFEGQVSTFNLNGGPNYRDLFPTPPPPELAPNCSEAGVLGVLPGIVGTIQATEALKVILGIGENLSGKLLTIDALTMEMRTLSFSKDPERVRATRLGESMGRDFEEIGAKDLAERRQGGWKPFLLDVRRAHEETIASIEGTDTRIMHLEIPTRLSELPTGTDIVVYCRSGQRSAAVARFIIESDLEIGRVFNLTGGILSWSDNVDPSIVKY
jgi:adenylyltransferase/sulfurtransferase